MCTAVAYRPHNFYFGRTLDYEFLYPCDVTFAPRGFPFWGLPQKHYGMLGMASVTDGYPLFFDGVNEKGLCMAGLNFVGNAVYRKAGDGSGVASFNFIPYILGRCESVKEAKRLLKDINITDEVFKEGLSASQLHWMVADKEETAVIESVPSGLKVYTNPADVLTNNPPFEYQLQTLKGFSHLSPKQAECQQTDRGFSMYTRGTGALGIPGDFTSESRFVRAAFLTKHAHSCEGEEAGINQLFHILSGVSVPEGCCITEDGKHNKTQYTSCIDASRGVYCWKGYGSFGVSAVDMRKEDMNSRELARYPFGISVPLININ